MACRLRTCVLAMLLLFSGLMGCGNSVPPRVLPDLPDASAASKAMELYDTNHDGFLDAKELEKVPGLKAAFKRSTPTTTARFPSRTLPIGSRTGPIRVSGGCRSSARVTHNGKPLAGAKVVFVPEKFLGGTLQSGSGTTVRDGLCHYLLPLCRRSLGPGSLARFLPRGNHQGRRKHPGQVQHGNNARRGGDRWLEARNGSEV